MRRPGISALVLAAVLAAGCSDADGEAPAEDAGRPHDHGTGGSPAPDGGSREDAGDAGGSGRADEACDLLVACGTVPGAPLDLERCRNHITDECVSCVLERAEADRDLDGGAEDACGSPADTGSDSCNPLCLSLVAAPSSTAECLDIVSATTSDPACLCEHCMDTFTACVEDTDCLRVADCCSRAGELGTACFFVPECMPIILELGPTSVSTALATQVGRCLTDNGCLGD